MLRRLEVEKNKKFSLFIRRFANIYNLMGGFFPAGEELW
jgi:hypothetical protein